MFSFATILFHLRAAIAARAARDRTLSVWYVAVWARIGRMGARLEQLIALWRAGELPQARTPRARQADKLAGNKPDYPTVPDWLLVHAPEVAAYGSQLQHLVSSEECAAFLAACPQAGRILRPLLHMLGSRPLPEPVRIKPRAVAVPGAAAPSSESAAFLPAVVLQFSGA
ncbi:MAG: hypothetical protein H7251_07080 [Acetobacteraceae bacterium]|nr:hypothetical protein [Acetobacteraceae bacterium]